MNATLQSAPMFPLRRLVIGGAAICAFFTTGCFYPAERGRLLEAKVDRLEGENSALRADLEKTREEIAGTLPKIDAKIAEVTKALESLDKASRRSDADTGVQLQKNIEDVAALRGQMETYLHQLNDLRAQLEKIDQETEKKILAMMGPEAAKAYEARRKLEEIERPSDPKAFLDLAATRAKAGDTQVARKLYDEFLRKWPRHELTGEAHFGLGELWYGEDKCREALFEYGKVIQEHAKTKSAPEAYLRSSDCFAKLKMKDEARLALEEVIKSHPKSNAARTAKARLAKMKKGK